MFNQNDYEAMDQTHRLLAATSSSSYRTCYKNLELKSSQFYGTYNKEEKFISESILRKNPNYLLIGDENYPKKLYDMAWPPLILFYEGDISLLDRPSIGVVGSRKVTAYGQKVTFDLATSLARIGIVIVSGGARGVDTIAHKSALKESGKTICVLGCGIDVCYPHENQKIFSEIMEDGLLLSEYPKGFKPQKWTFPMRNRIIAALSDEIIVTEAAKKSGSLHTATYGEELNRTIHSVPHEITSYNGIGNHELIEMGARIFYNKNHFIIEFLENHPSSLKFRMNDLKLNQLKISQEDLVKILDLDQICKKRVTEIMNKIHLL